MCKRVCSWFSGCFRSSVCSRGPQEPERDVSFIQNETERVLIQDAIDAVSSIPGAWASLRTREIKAELANLIRSNMKNKHNDESFLIMMQLLTHISINWDEWVMKRSLTQDKDAEIQAYLENWKKTYKWNENSNNTILLALLENIYKYVDANGILHAQRVYHGIDKMIFDLEVAIARISVKNLDSFKNFLDEYSIVGEENVEAAVQQFKESMEFKMEVCKKVVEVDVPVGYQFCRNRWLENSRYIESCNIMRKSLEDSYKYQLGDLEEAIMIGSIDALEKALYKPFVDMSLVRKNPVYMEAFNLYQKLKAEEDGETVAI